MWCWAEGRGRLSPPALDAAWTTLPASEPHSCAAYFLLRVAGTRAACRSFGRGCLLKSTGAPSNKRISLAPRRRPHTQHGAFCLQKKAASPALLIARAPRSFPPSRPRYDVSCFSTSSSAPPSVELAANGADIVAIDIAGPVSPASNALPATPEELEETTKMIRAFGRRAETVRADIRDIAALRRFADQTDQQFGKIDILVANAAIQRWKPLWRWKI